MWRQFHLFLSHQHASNSFSCLILYATIARVMLSGNSQDNTPLLSSPFEGKNHLAFATKYNTSCRFFIDNFSKLKKFTLTFCYKYLFKLISCIYEDEYVFCFFSPLYSKLHWLIFIFFYQYNNAEVKHFLEMTIFYSYILLDL